MESTQHNFKIGKYVCVYLLITYILYLTLPISRTQSGAVELYTIFFLIFVCISFYMGCRSIHINVMPPTKHINRKIISSTQITIILTALSIIQSMYIVDLINSGIASLSATMGEAYAERLQAEVSGNSLWGQFYVLASPVRVLMIVYCTYYFNYLSKISKILYFILVALAILYSIAQGVQVGIGNIAVYILIPLYFRKRKENKLNQLRLVLIVFVVLFTAFFIINQYQRAEVFGSDVGASISDKDNIYYTIFGEKIGAGIIRLLSYVSHGYLGLNYSLQLPFEWTYGYGGSRALNQYLTQYLQLPSQFEYAYPMRVFAVFGYDCQQSWPTAFAWWASDFSFPGVVVLMYFIGKITCMVFRDAIQNDNIIAMAFMSVLVIMLVFLPMNNQILQARDSLVTTIVLAFLWYRSRKKTKA